MSATISEGIYYRDVPKQITLDGANELSQFIYQTPKQPLAVEIARTVTSKHNQDARIMTVGTQGKGKSWLNLTLGYAIAREIARIQNKKKGNNVVWSDYFGMGNIVIMDDSKVKEVLSDIQQFNIYSFDDIGIAWSARESMSRGNKLLNDVFQVFRTENTVILMSIISDFLIDKVPRNLVTYQQEMDMSLFDYRWVFPKVFHVVGKPREHTPHYHYPRTTNDIAVVRYAAPAPPKFLSAEYDVVRREAATKLRVERMGGDEDENNGGKKLPPNTFDMEGKYVTVDKLTSGTMKSKGKVIKLSVRAACKAVDCAENNYADRCNKRKTS